MKMKKKGVALLWAIITSSVVLFIASIVATAIIKESKMTVSVESSTSAFAAASSGVEWAKWCIDHISDTPSCNPGAYTSASPMVINLTGSSASIAITNSGTDYKIESTGRNSNNTVTRKLLYDYTPTTFQSGAYNLTGSFSFTYDFWRDPASISSEPTDIGVTNGTEYVAARMTFSGANLTIAASYRAADGTTFVSAAPQNIVVNSSIFPRGWSDPFAFRVRVDYVKDTALQVTFMNRTNARDLENCTQRFSIDMTGNIYQQRGR